MTWPSIIANDAPMQRRAPPPNGSHVVGVGTSPRNRCGSKSCGDGYASAERCASTIDGETVTPDGYLRPPTVVGSCSSRITIGTTGCRRSTSLITASRYSVPPCSISSTHRSCTSGWRASSSIAQAIAVAVVSCPAATSVMSWSRSSSSVSPWASSAEARTSSASKSRRSGSAGSRRAASISSPRKSWMVARSSISRRHGPNPCNAGMPSPIITTGPASTARPTIGRIRSSRFESDTPNTTRKMTSSVSSLSSR